jgi:hypothetical protein
MPKSSNDGITTSSDTTTSTEHSRTNPQLQHAIVSELNQSQGAIKRYFLAIKCDDSHPSRAIQWVLLAVITIITLITLMAPLVLALLKSQALLAIPSVGALPLGYIWVRLALFSFPVNERDHEYRMAKLRLNYSEQHLEVRKNKRTQEQKLLVQDNTDSTIL